jgi:hypothetical protein
VGAKTFIVAAGVVVTACGTHTVPKPQCPRLEMSSDWVPRQRALATRENLTGNWIAVKADARPGPALPVSQCPYDAQDYWMLEQSGTVVRAWHVMQRQAVGVILHDYSSSYEAADGTRGGDEITLKGSFVTVTYKDTTETGRSCAEVELALRFDPESGHLVGSRNGSAIRLAPIDYRTISSEPQPDCNPPP